MQKHKVILVFGTRPEAIKLAPVILGIRAASCLELKVVVTAQHREMLDQVLNLFDICPDYDLNIMRPDQNPLQVIQRILVKLRPILEHEDPDILLIQGDTATTFAAALAGFHLKIPVAHVEAGLRTYDKHQPFPEEMNRRLTTALADWHFAPTEWARENLLKEEIPPERIFVTGNTVIDALLFVLEHTQCVVPAWVEEAIAKRKRLLLVTVHRRENWGRPLQHICIALKQILTSQTDVIIAFSVHMNPNVRRVVFKQLKGQERLFLLEPLDYVNFVHLMACSYFILTDSGGIQEEAPSLGKPVLVLRQGTERPEGVKAGVLKLIGTHTDRIVDEAVKLLNDADCYRKMLRDVSPYGDGKASDRIVHILGNILQGPQR